MDKNYIFTFFQSIKFFTEFLHILHFYGIAINNLYVIKLFTFGNKISKFYEEFFLIFSYCFLPDKSIFVCTGFNFCTINKNSLPGDFAKFKQCIGHFCQYPLGTGSKMNTSKTCKCCMIRSGLTLQKEHEIDVSFTI